MTRELGTNNRFPLWTSLLGNCSLTLLCHPLSPDVAAFLIRILRFRDGSSLRMTCLWTPRFPGALRQAHATERSCFVTFIDGLVCLFISLYLFHLFISFCVYASFACIYVCVHMHACSMTRSEEGSIYHGTGVTDGCELPRQYWKQNQDPLEEQVF